MFLLQFVLLLSPMPSFSAGRQILKTLDGSTDFTEPGVDVYCIHGSDIPTAAQFRYVVHRMEALGNHDHLHSGNVSKRK